MTSRGGDVAEQLWFDEGRKDFFLLPDSDGIAAGDLYLRTFDGRVRGFDAEALAAHRVDAETAQPYVRAWIESGYSRARSAFARGSGEEPRVPESLEAAIGVDPARLGSDPEALLEAAQHVGQSLRTWLDRDAPPEVAESVRTASSALAQLITGFAQAVNEGAGGPGEDPTEE